MEILIYTVLSLGAYFVQVLVCTSYHIIKGTRDPSNLLDFIKLTFLPYIIYKVIKGDPI